MERHPAGSIRKTMIEAAEGIALDNAGNAIISGHVYGAATIGGVAVKPKSNCEAYVWKVSQSGP